MEQIGKTKEGGEIENELIFLKQELVEKNKKIRKLEEENEKLKFDSIHDGLTGLKNKRYFAEKTKGDISTVFAPELKKRKEGFKDISFLFCDIDHFKEINDTYGHFFGDEILKEIAWLLKENVRDSDTVCRWGGDEMVISLLGADGKEAVEKAEELRRAIEEMVERYRANPKYSGLKASLSIGVSSSGPGLSFDELIKRGDQAMYLAKKEGKNCIRTYSEIKEKENIMESFKLSPLFKKH